MRSIWSFAPKVNLAAPGAIGATTAGSGAFSTLTVGGTLAVTQGTTLTGGLNLGPLGGGLLTTTSSLSDYSSSSSLNLGTTGPSITTYYTAGGPTKWIAINDDGTTRYIPTWHDDPP